MQVAIKETRDHAVPGANRVDGFSLRRMAQQGASLFIQQQSADFSERHQHIARAGLLDRLCTAHRLFGAF